MIRVTRLANGFTVASDRMDSVETVSLGVWADVGTRNEPAEINGVSHLLEHMAFKGTERRSARAIAEEIEAVGGHLNAYTAREQTAYYAKILAGDLPLAVDIIGDILQHSTFDAEELARERAVVLIVSFITALVAAGQLDRDHPAGRRCTRSGSNRFYCYARPRS